jgi:hypothetical protein
MHLALCFIGKVLRREEASETSDIIQSQPATDKMRQDQLCRFIKQGQLTLDINPFYRKNLFAFDTFDMNRTI